MREYRFYRDRVLREEELFAPGRPANQTHPLEGIRKVAKRCLAPLVNFLRKEENMDIHNLTEIIANQGFPIALSILLIFRIDRFMQEIVTAQKEGYRQILENTKEIHHTITSLNQQNREYYSLRFSEVQKELSGMKVKLGRIE